ncbi:aromatic acid exporter family protein [Actinokineospora sp. NBRC 105648]|uniref:aromatic acid exporter family protein n=1 Tax=Actinokineospora sp. NBRC 105648 TaxID=3032206 RepID=UPI003327E93B
MKAAAAAVLAWVLADRVLHLPQPFLAPYSAVLVVESTVFRSIKGSAQQSIAASTAVLVALLASRLIPEPHWARCRCAGRAVGRDVVDRRDRSAGTDQQRRQSGDDAARPAHRDRPRRCPGHPDQHPGPATDL